MAAGACEQVVGMLCQLARTAPGENEMLFDGLDQGQPVLSLVERAHFQAGPASRGLRQRGGGPGQSFVEEPPLGQADSGIDEGDRQFVGQPFEVIVDREPVFAVLVDEVDVVDDPDTGSQASTQSSA